MLQTGLLKQGFFHIREKKWFFYSLLTALLIALPLIFIIVNGLTGQSEYWQHVAGNLLGEYLFNTFTIMAGVGALALLIGVSSAWLVSNFKFPFHRFFEWGMILPLAIPTYIIAFTYSGIFDYTGSYRHLMGGLFSDATVDMLTPDVVNIYGIIIILSLVLYPYVFLTSKIAFSLSSSSFIEASKSLRTGSWKTFFKVALPLARPAIVGGLFLVLMEILNDYGAVKYFGINTLTTGIFRMWFSYDDIDAAIRLSSILLLSVLFLLYIEKKQRGKKKYHTNMKNPPLIKKQLKGGKAALAFAVVFLPFLFGFLVPVSQLIGWATVTFDKVVDADFFQIVLNSFGLGAASAILCALVAVFLIYSSRINKSPISTWLNKISGIGYAIPGAVIAIGVLSITLLLNQLFSNFNDAFYIASGGVGLLIYAYIVRFLAVSMNTVEGGFEKISNKMDESSTALGKSSFQTLFRIHMPLLKRTILAAMILTFVDTLKELPLTLILRPFNFDTLATKAFEYAGDEMVAHASAPSLMIILIAIPTIYVLHRASK